MRTKSIFQVMVQLFIKRNEAGALTPAKELDMKESTRIEQIKKMPDSHEKWSKVVSLGLRIGCFDKRFYKAEMERLTKLGYNRA